MTYLFWLGEEGERIADNEERAEFAHLCELLCPCVEVEEDG